MKKYLISGLTFAALAAVAVVFITGRTEPVNAENHENNINGQYVYAAKFICGLMKFNPNFKGEPPVKPGNYATAVNIHNPQGREAFMLKKAVQALTEPEQGKPTDKREFVLGPDGATEADCNEIYAFLQKDKTQKPFVKGFFVIESQVPLDVVGVYTASLSTSGSLGTSLEEDVEYIPASKVLPVD